MHDNRLLADRYRLEAEIGIGGTGTVYRATDTRTGGHVAVKVLYPHLARDAAFRQRLAREATIASALTSPRVVRIIDIAAGVEADPPFLVMEYVAGETLRARLTRAGPLAPVAALRIALEIARALDAAHAAGVVHRDLKPENVMLVEDQVKVLDFGIAREVVNAGRSTAYSYLLATPEYTAPERSWGQNDIRVDIYALGIVLFELLEGGPPFHAPDPLLTLRLHEQAPLPSFQRDLPAPVLDVVSRSLAKLPAARYQTPADQIRALRAALGALAEPAATETEEEPEPTAVDGAPMARLTRPVPEAPAPPTPHNLPLPATSFVGRERELAEVERLLLTSRLLVLTSVGGCGKTRLALEAARSVLRRFPDGVWWVELAALADPILLTGAVAAVVGVREQPNRPLLETLVEYLRPRTALIVLDNCEHLAEAARRCVTTLLDACPNVQVLASSREGLGVRHETAWNVPSLALPSAHTVQAAGASSPDALAAYDAIRLFVERAQERRPDFALTAANAPRILDLCRRVNGIPLAIELVAARATDRPLTQLAVQLQSRLRGVDGAGDQARERQRTLEATMDWTYDRLSAAQRRLFRRLAVFAGGFEAEAAAEVCQGSGIGGDLIAALIAQLVEHSLVGADSGAAGRFRLLEPMRQYAAERLYRAREATAVRRRHFAWYVSLLTEGEWAFRDARQQRWMERLDRDIGNLRAALGWSLEDRQDDDGLWLSAALQRFWQHRGHLSEGRLWTSRLLAAAGDAKPSTRAKALECAGVLAWLQGDYAAADDRLTQCLAIRRTLEGGKGVAATLGNLGLLAGARSDYVASRRYYSEALALQRENNDDWGASTTLDNLGTIAQNQGELDTAQALHEEALALAKKIGDKAAVARIWNNLALVARHRKDYKASKAFHRRSLRLQRRLGDQRSIAMSLMNLGIVAHDLGDDREARDCTRKVSRSSATWVIGWGSRSVFATSASLPTARTTIRPHATTTEKVWQSSESWETAV